jgi:hypothetical protein
MQRLSLLLLCLTLLGQEVAIASPTDFPPTGPGGWSDWNHRQCISDAQAADFVDKIHSLYHCMDSVLAEQTLTEDFMSFSYTWLRGSHENLITVNQIQTSLFTIHLPHRHHTDQEPIHRKETTSSPPPAPSSSHKATPRTRSRAMQHQSRHIRSGMAVI